MKNLDKNNSVDLLVQEDNFRWLLCNGTKFKQELQSWESKGQMMWITFLDNNFENKWFRLETEDLGWIEWNENNSNVIMDICREEFSNEKWGISNTSQMLMGNSMRDNL
jgi:hypothetical protein